VHPSLLPCHVGSFNPASSAYELKSYPDTTGSYTAVVLLRHPSVPNSRQVLVIEAHVVQDPALAAAARSTPAPSTPAAVTATAAAALTAGPLFNPMSMPRVKFTAVFPAMTAGGYGGVARVMSDYRSILAATAGLDSSDWVTAAVLQQAPLALSTTVRVFRRECVRCGTDRAGPCVKQQFRTYRRTLSRRTVVLALLSVVQTAV
jgi:hypothetical protein